MVVVPSCYRPTAVEAAVAPEEFAVRDGEVLILSPSDEASSRFKRKPGKGVLAWGRMVAERFAKPTQAAPPPEVSGSVGRHRGPSQRHTRSLVYTLRSSTRGRVASEPQAPCSIVYLNLHAYAKR